MKDMREKFTVIHNGVDIALFNRNDREKFRTECGVAKDEFLVGMVGVVSEHKGVDDFLRAAGLMLKKLNNLKFVLVGPEKPSGFSQRMKQLAEELNISDRVIFTGFRHDIAEIMTSLDLLLTPSRVEAFGRVIIESLASRTPVVAYHVGGIPEIISNSEVGVLVPVDDVEKLAQEAVEILSDDTRREVLAQSGYDHVCKHFTIQSHVKKVEDIYDTLLNR